jgi:hypothetical protein
VGEAETACPNQQSGELFMSDTDILNAAAIIYAASMVTKHRGYTRTFRTPTISMEEAVAKAKEMQALITPEEQ